LTVRRVLRDIFSFSCILLTDMFLAVQRASGPVFYVLRFQTCFRRYRGRQLLFSCFAFSDSFSAVRRVSGPVFMFFARPDSFSAVTRASGPVCMFCAPGHVFGGTKGVGVLFSYFALPGSFPAVLRAFDPVLIFSAPRLVFCGTEGVGSRFHILLSQTRFRRYRGCRVPFSCFARPDSFSVVPRA
jgi:hypothetical protein